MGEVSASNLEEALEILFGKRKVDLGGEYMSELGIAEKVDGTEPLAGVPVTVMLADKFDESPRRRVEVIGEAERLVSRSSHTDVYRFKLSEMVVGKRRRAG